MYLNAFDELQKAVRAGTCKTKTKKPKQKKRARGHHPDLQMLCTQHRETELHSTPQVLSGTAQNLRARRFYYKVLESNVTRENQLVVLKRCRDTDLIMNHSTYGLFNESNPVF